MTYEIRENCKAFDTADSFEAARAKVEAMGSAYMEIDADYPDCADALLNDGRIISIQPVGFKL